MLQQIQGQAPQYQFLKTVHYLSTQHFITYSRQKVIIFAREILQHLQTMRNFTSDIVAVASSRRKGAIVVFCEKEIVTFKPIVCNGNTIRWTKAFQKNCSHPIQDAFFSNDDEYLIGCTAQSLRIWKVEHTKETAIDLIDQNAISQINEIFNVDLEDQIMNVKFTPDLRYFCTLSSNQQTALKVWNFDAILAFPLDGDIESLPQTKLFHQDNVLSFKIRETLRVSPSPLPSPTSIVTLTSANLLTVWQEQPFQMLLTSEPKKIIFIMISTVQLQNVSSFCFIYGYHPHPFPWSDKFIDPDSIGVQDIEDPTIDYILVHQEDEVQILKLEQLRNYSLQSNINTIHQYTNPKLMKSIKKIIYTNQIFENEIEKIEIVGFDRLWNICKLVINLSDQSDFRIYTSEKFSFGEIIFFSFDKLSQTVCVYNNLSLLCNFKATHLITLNNEYEVKPTDDFITWKVELDKNKYQHMFHIKDAVMFIPNTLDELLLLQLNSRILVARSIKITNIIQMLEKESFQFDQIQLAKSQVKNDQYELIFLLLHKNQIIILRMLLSDQIFQDKAPTQNIQISYLHKVNLNFKFTQITFGEYDENYDFFSIDRKLFSHYSVDKDGQFILKVNIQKQFMIQSGGHLKGLPYIYYIISSQNEIDFHNSSGDFLTKFTLSQFLVRVDSAIYDVQKLIMQIFPITSDSFYLQIENYIIIMKVVFDKQTQVFKLITLKKQQLDQVGRNEYYCLRLSKNSNPSQYTFFDMQNEGNVLLKTGRNIKIINNSLVHQMRNLDQILPIPQTISLMFLQNKNKITHQDPDFLNELYQIGKLQLVDYSFHLIGLKLRKQGQLGTRFMIPLNQISRLFTEVTPQDFQEEPQWIYQLGKFVYSDETILSEELLQQLESTQDILPVIKNIAEGEYKRALGLDDKKLTNLLQLIEFQIYVNKNKRSLDFYAQMFMFHVERYRNLPRQGKRLGSLASKEVVWALHSIQKDTLWQECITFQSQDKDLIIWSLVRRYCAVIWMDNLELLKTTLEKIAMAQYKVKKDPFSALLYYVMLGKRNVVAMLFKKETQSTPEYKNTYEFLMKDFTEDRWKSAASKNAYALLGKKRYQDACAFFLLGGHLADAVNVIAVYLEDIQLALLCARIFENGKSENPVTQKLINDQFIKTGETMNDIWLLHIGYHLLGQHVDSLNVLQRAPQKCDTNVEYDNLGQKLCQSWSPKYEPQLSCYHPSAIIFSQKLEDSILIKREIQQSEQPSEVKQQDIFSAFYSDSDEEQEEQEEIIKAKTIQRNLPLLKEQALEYYYNISIPILGILVHQSNDNVIGTDIYLQKLVTSQIQSYVEDAINENEQFTNYVMLLQHIDEFVNYVQLDKNQMYRIAFDCIKSLRSPSRILTFSVNYDAAEYGISQFTQFCTEAQSLIYRLCYCYSLNAQSQEYYGTLLQTIYELDTGLKIFQQTKYYQFVFIKCTVQQKNSLNIIKLFSLFTALILTLELHLWQFSQDILRKIEIFSHEVFAKQNYDWGYENQREDFYDAVLSKIQIYFNSYKTKSRKAHRNADVLADAFPEDKYDLQVLKDLNDQQLQLLQQQQPESSVSLDNYPPLKQAEISQNRNVCCELILGSIMKTLVVKYFLSISRCYFSNFKEFTKFNINSISYSNIFRLAEQYQFNRHNQVMALLQSIKDYAVEQKILDDISSLAKTELSYKQSEYFQEIEQLVDPNLFYCLSQKVHVENYCDLLSLQLNKYCFKYPRSTFDERNMIQYKNKLFKSGVEVYRVKSDTLKAFCVNRAKCQGQDAVVLYGKSLKKTNFLYNLMNRNRTQDGYGLIDEETIQSEDIPVVKDEQLLSKPFIVRMACSIISENDRFVDENYILQKHSQTQSHFFSEGEKQSEKVITDYSDHQILCAHPHLPFFLSGSKGTIDLFSFKQLQHQQEYTTGHKDHIEQIKFNNKGDMFLAIDSNYNSSIFRLQKNNKSSLPLFALSHKTKPCTDMCFVNESSVIATIHSSSSKPHFAIYDLLLPSSRNCILNENFLGSDIMFSSPHNSLLICNGKKGIVNFYDIRKNQIYQNLEIPQLQIKHIGMNSYENKLVCSCSDGSVKIYNIDDMEKVADIKPFRQDKKPPTITNLCLTDNLALTSSSDGCISIVYLNV